MGSPVINQPVSLWRQILGTALVGLGGATDRGLADSFGGGVQAVQKRRDQDLQNELEQQRVGAQVAESQARTRNLEAETAMAPERASLMRSQARLADMNAALAVVQKLNLEKQIDHMAEEDKQKWIQLATQQIQAYSQAGMRPAFVTSDDPEELTKVQQQYGDGAWKNYIPVPDHQGKVYFFENRPDLILPKGTVIQTPWGTRIDASGLTPAILDTMLSGDASIRSASIHAQSALANRTRAIQTVNERGEAITRIVPDTVGSEFPLAPTADMRNKQTARERIIPAINALENLGSQVITELNAAAQKARAAGRTVEAELGNDPKFRTYQDARMALAGNLAVAQQGSRPSDADVKAIWLPLVPDVFKDTKESAALKWQMIRVNSGLTGAAPQQSTQPIYAVNQKTQERIVSTDGGKTWQPAQ